MVNAGTVIEDKYLLNNEISDESSSLEEYNCPEEMENKLFFTLPYVRYLW